MAYGKIKADTLVYDNSGSDVETTVASLAAKAGLASPAFTGTATAVNLTLSGNLQVNGTTTTVASSTMTVTDKNIEIAKGAANDAAADGAGITVDSGDGDKTWNWVDATDAWTSSEHIHILDSKKLFVGTGSDLTLTHDGTNSKIDNNTGSLTIETTSNEVHNVQSEFQVKVKGGSEDGLKVITDGAVEAYHNNVKKFETTSSGVTVTGTVSDSKGDLRKIPENAKTSAYALVAADAGKCITSTTGGITVNYNEFSGGSAVTIINHSGSDMTITQGSSLTMYNTADAATGNRTLAGRGMATIWFQSTSVCYISGAGLS